MKRLLLLTVLACFFLINKTISQDFVQLSLPQDSLYYILSKINVTLIETFGRNKNALLISKQGISDYNKYSPYLATATNNRDTLVYFVLNTSENKIKALSEDVFDYYPIGFINDDTLLFIKKAQDNHIKAIGYSLTHNAIHQLDNDFAQSINKLPYFLCYQNQKFSSDLSKTAFLDKDDDNNIIVLDLDRENIEKHKINPGFYLDNSLCIDFFWLNNTYILLLLVRDVGNDIEYSQLVININTKEIITNIVFPENFDNLHDLYKGLAILGGLDNNIPKHLICETHIHEDTLFFKPKYTIINANEYFNHIGYLKFISSRVIARSTTFEAERELIQIFNNLSLPTHPRFKISPFKLE